MHSTGEGFCGEGVGTRSEYDATEYGSFAPSLLDDDEDASCIGGVSMLFQSMVVHLEARCDDDVVLPASKSMFLFRRQ